ncbi:hypothetical protein CfE428DRAFT_5606 [Chthoniobacter flavus Ellin428]|uniref:Uncharacterized protein n=2 Tax=Chthoniobacter flavus TaxID=191863 RepID=B4D9L6_9BACT|nr:hypothetical protein CfE428DRAFT_5606 [Chthoniobacter flavus Ellin428]TCO93378.1 hypothetical protein EV701_10482 [Chthoniobacter flavus]
MLKLNGGDGFFEPVSRYPEILRPASIPCEHAEGWGSHRIRIDGVDIAFSDEDFGFQVTFESDSLSEQRATQIMDDICENIRVTTGASTKVVSL